HEKDFFDGIDTSMPGLADRLGSEKAKAPELKSTLVEFQMRVERATEEAAKSPERAAVPLLEASAILDQATQQVNKAGLSPAAKLDLLTTLREKQKQCET